MVDFIIAIIFILAVLSSWIFVQHLARKFAALHPEFGPAKEEGSGCGKSCLCKGGACKNKQQAESPSHKLSFSKNNQEDQLS